MKYLLGAVGALLALAIALLVLQYVASERVEVVELHSQSDSDEMVTTRLWIVDHDNLAYLRGDEGSGWYARIRENPQVQLTRNGKTDDYIAIPRLDKRDVINRLMQEKYTWGDTIISALVGSRDNAIPVELRPPNDS